MDLKSAIATGKRIRRSSIHAWELPRDLRFTIDDVTWENWLVEEPSIVITKTEFIFKWQEMLRDIKHPCLPTEVEKNVFLAQLMFLNLADKLFSSK